MKHAFHLCFEHLWKQKKLMIYHDFYHQSENEMFHQQLNYLIAEKISAPMDDLLIRMSRKAVSKIQRLLRKGGHLILGDPTGSKWMLPVMNFCIKFSNKGDYHLYSINEIEELFCHAGFTVLQSRMITPKSFLAHFTRCGQAIAPSSYSTC